MSYLLAAAAAPVVGPLLYWGLHRRDGWVRLVDGFVLLAVPVLVALQVLPSAVRERSVVGVVLLALGLLVPTLFERVSRSLQTHTDSAALIVGFSGLALHALLEGASLTSAGPDDLAFGSAVVLHRIPVGLAVWWLMRPRYGVGVAAAAIFALVAVTVVGYSAGGGLVSAWPGPGSDLYQAFVGGSLLHVVFHQGRHDHAHDHAH